MCEGDFFHFWAGILFSSVFTTVVFGPWSVVGSVWEDSCFWPPHGEQSSGLVFLGLQVFSWTWFRNETVVIIFPLRAAARSFFYSTCSIYHSYHVDVKYCKYCLWYWRDCESEAVGSWGRDTNVHLLWTAATVDVLCSLYTQQGPDTH